jgi:hypothetical protein
MQTPQEYNTWFMQRFSMKRGLNIKCPNCSPDVEMVETSGEHGLTATDILISFMNNEMLQEERDEIIERIKKED